MALFVLIGLILASFFAGAMSGAGMWLGGTEEIDAGFPATSFPDAQTPLPFMPNNNSLSPEIDNKGNEKAGTVTASSSITCNSCEDCTNKLNSGLYDTVILSQDILNHTGNCIDFNADNVVFDCAGHSIGGDSPFDIEYGIKLTEVTT